MKTMQKFYFRRECVGWLKAVGSANVSAWNVQFSTDVNYVTTCYRIPNSFHDINCFFTLKKWSRLCEWGRLYECT